MKTFIYPTKDTSIYEDAPYKNTGIDQVLELRHYLSEGNIPYNSRILIDFNLTNISQSISRSVITNPKFFLRLFATDAYEIKKNYDVEVLPISQNWDMGLGKYKHDPQTTNGASWTYSSDYATGDVWITSSYSGSVTGSWSTIAGGGNWYGDSELYCTQSFDYETTDLRVDVTNIVNSWLDGTIPQNGFLIKRTDSDEAENSYQTKLGFFSNESNTVFSPRLEIAWDDSTSVTSSINLLSVSDDIVINPLLNYKYKEKSRVKIRVNARPRFMRRTFVTSSQYLENYYIPTSSQYQIRDAVTGDILIDYDEYTKISQDENGNYITLWFDAFQPERFYTISFKIEDDNGYVSYYDNNYNFKVVR